MAAWQITEDKGNWYVDHNDAGTRTRLGVEPKKNSNYQAIVAWMTDEAVAWDSISHGRDFVFYRQGLNKELM
jgi:hypothetical protein